MTKMFNPFLAAFSIISNNRQPRRGIVDIHNEGSHTSKFVPLRTIVVDIDMNCSFCPMSLMQANVPASKNSLSHFCGCPRLSARKALHSCCLRKSPNKGLPGHTPFCIVARPNKQVPMALRRFMGIDHVIPGLHNPDKPTWSSNEGYGRSQC